MILSALQFRFSSAGIESAVLHAQPSKRGEYAAMRNLSLFLITLALVSPVVGAEQTVPMVGVGAEACARYVENRRNYDQGAFDGEYAYAVVEWVRGFASGYNYAVASAEMRRKAPLFSSAIVAFLDKYCRDFPSGVVEHGARCLLAELNNDSKPCGD